jgi:hypothetical protein
MVGAMMACPYRDPKHYDGKGCESCKQYDGFLAEEWENRVEKFLSEVGRELRSGKGKPHALVCEMGHAGERLEAVRAVMKRLWEMCGERVFVTTWFFDYWDDDNWVDKGPTVLTVVFVPEQTEGGVRPISLTRCRPVHREK